MSVKVAVELIPAVTVAGESVRLCGTGATIVSDPVTVFPFTLALMLAVAFAATDVVVTVNVALVWPLVTVTEPGAVAAALFEAIRSVNPAGGAGEFSVTVAVELVPPVTLDGESVSVAGIGAVMLSAALADLPLKLAVMFAVLFVDTPDVYTTNVVLILPPGTMINPGTVAAPLSEESVTFRPWLGAGPVSMIVAVEEPPPMTVVGDRVRLVMVEG